MSKYILAVPNFSDGRRKEVIEAVVDQVRGVPGVKLLDYHPDPDFNRTVVTVIGEPVPLRDALLNMAGKSIELIDMEQQSGSHPRIGAQDTIPIFPLRGISLGECIELAEEIGREVFRRFEVPVYFTSENARRPERRSLDVIRKGQYEGLKQVAHTEERRPDIGPARLHPSAGATIVSAGTNPLVAYNVILDTNRLDVAKKIAKIVRGPSGGFTTVRSIGLMFEERDQVAISMNMFDYEKTPIYRTFQLVKLEAARYGVNVVGSEIVGVVSQESLINSLEYFLGLENFDRSQILENHLIGLDAGLENGAGAEKTFLEQLAAGTPTPGGGSAAAYSAAMAASLVAMVARLTVGKAKYADVWDRMQEIASQAERLSYFFQIAVERDEDAFLALMESRRLPKETPEQQAARAKAIEKATLEAGLVPLEVAQKVVTVLALAREAAENGNANAITDAASAALLARTALACAGLNVRINATSLVDRSRELEWENELVNLEQESDQVIRQINTILKARSGLSLGMLEVN